MTGTTEEIATLRSRYQLISDSITQLEARVAENAAELERLSRSYGDDDGEMGTFQAPQLEETDITEEDIQSNFNYPLLLR